MSVTGIIVTRGDVDVEPCFETWPKEWEVLVWDNGHGFLRRMVYNAEGSFWQKGMSVADAAVTDLSVYGRYAAIEYASHDLIYVQDDDVIVSDPQQIVDRWRSLTYGPPMLPVHTDLVVSNMPPEFRHAFYEKHSLVGFGACFHRSQPERVFMRFLDHYLMVSDDETFLRTCDIVLTGLSRRAFVDVPKADREMASAPNRMWRQPTHVGERQRMLDLVVPLRAEIMREEDEALRERLGL